MILEIAGRRNLHFFTKLAHDYTGWLAGKLKADTLLDHSQPTIHRNLMLQMEVAEKSLEPEY
jgi:hypothetical protein